MATVSNSSSPAVLPRIDLTARDFFAHKTALIEFLRDNYPNDFTDFTESQIGIALLELASVGLANLSYYQNRIGNEVYLATARERRNIIHIARMLGYRPSLSTSASVNLDVDTSGISLTNPPITFVVTQGQALAAAGLRFEVDRNYTLLYDGTNWYQNSTLVSAPFVGAVEGKKYTETLRGDGTVFQTFALTNYPVVAGTVTVTVDGVAWTEAESLVLAPDPDDPNIYEVKIDEKDRATLLFGDGITGKIVPTGAQVVVTYRVGGGAKGNVTARALSGTLPATRTDPSGTTSVSLPVTNTNPASGGQDRESDSSIKFFAPAFLKTNDRAITATDYRALSAGYTDAANGTVAKAGVLSSPSDGISNVVTVYAWTADSNNDLVAVVPAPLRTSLQQFLQARKVVTVQAAVANGTNVAVDVIAKIRVDARYDTTTVQNAVTAAVAGLFREDRVRYENELRYSWIVDTIMNVPGVKWCHVTSPVCTVEESTGEELHYGTLGSQAGASTVDEIILPTAWANLGNGATDTTSTQDGFYANYRIDVTGGVGLGQTRKIVSYTGSSRKAKVEKAWDTGKTPASGDTLRLWHPRLLRFDTTQASSTTDFYNYRVVSLVSGTGAGQTRTIIDYQQVTPTHSDGSFVARLDADWSTHPDATSRYLILADLKCREFEALVQGPNTAVTVLSGDDES
jgi:hypothetical protein